jgi:alpha-1,6-mannosyltransferase
MLQFDDDSEYRGAAGSADAVAFAAGVTKERAVALQSKGEAGPDLDDPLRPSATPAGPVPAVTDQPLLGFRDRLRLYLLGPGPGEEVTPYRPDPDLIPVDPGSWGRYGLLVLSALAGLAGSLLIAASAPVWYLAAPAWRLIVPGVPHPGSSFQSAAFFVVGLVLLVLGWIGLIGRAARAPMTARRRLWAVVAVGALWCLPMLAAPPLLSHDAYSYAAQARMASLGIDPSANGPDVLRYGYFYRQADPIWRDAPAPYGPVAVGFGETIVTLTGQDAATTVWGFRVLSLIGVIMAGVGVASIARRLKQSPAVAVAVGVASPLVLLHLIGGSHNDAIMMGFTALGLAAFVRGRKFLGVGLVILATGIKVPAAAALVFMAWNWNDDPDVPIRRRVRDLAIVGGSTLAGLAALCAAVGIGFGWITALKNTGKIFSTFSVSTKTGFLAADVVHAVGIDVPATTMVAVTRLLGLAAAVLICTVLLLRSPRIGMVRALGLSMLAVVILSPVVWPWYLAVGFALVAASGMGRWRPSYVVVIIAASAVVWPTSVDPVKSLNEYQHLLTMGVVVLIAAACWGAQRVAATMAARRPESEVPGSAGEPTGQSVEATALDLTSV